MTPHVAGPVVALLATTSAVGVATRTVTSAVRPEGADVRTLLERGVERSAAFRSLVSSLDSGDVVVYVRWATCDGRVRACLLWASADATTRRVLIKIDRLGGFEDDLISLLAHELQHASEVAAAPSITDVSSFRRWLQEHARHGSHGFETDAAAAVTRAVAAELRIYGSKVRGRR